MQLHRYAGRDEQNDTIHENDNMEASGNSCIVIQMMTMDHHFWEPKVDDPESDAFSSRTTHFWMKILSGDEDCFK